MELTKQQRIRTGGFFLFLIALFFLLNGVTPSLFSLLPNDYVRTSLIIETLKDTTSTPEVVVFGNSRGMSGIDGNRLGEGMKNHPLVYSFTSTGQQPSESALYYSSLPQSVKTVIQCVDIDLLSTPMGMDISNQVALHMYGYKMDEETRRLIPSFAEVLDRSSIYYNYEARNCLFTGLSFWLRSVLDDDAPQNSIAQELHYPTSQTSYRNEKTYQQDINRQNQLHKFDSFKITPQWVALLNDSYAYFNQRGIAYYVVLMPYNSDIAYVDPVVIDEAYQQYKRQCNRIPHINCLRILEASDFYDAIHPNDKGARKITDQVLTSLP